MTDLETRNNIIMRSVSLLMTLRGTLGCDNEASLNYARRGIVAFKNVIDETVALMLDMEKNLDCAEKDLAVYKNECREYGNLLHGYSSDGLDEKRKAALNALIAQWEKEDEEDD